jgi:solute carrier family 25 protein 39/40
MVLRDVPFSAVYFPCLEAARSSASSSAALGRWGARYHRERGDRPPPAVDAIEAFAGGMAAGSIATVLTTPFDVVKTRWMTAGIGPVGAGAGDRDSRGGRGGRVLRGGGDTLLGHMRRIVEEEGVRGGLWRGNWARMIKVAPGSAIMISSYELGKRLLEDVM